MVDKAVLGVTSNLPAGCGVEIAKVRSGYWWGNGTSINTPYSGLDCEWSRGYHCGRWDSGYAYCLCLRCAERAGILW